MTVADRIKNLRTELGMSQGELAAKIGIKNKSSICKIESHGNDITLKDISRIAEALGTTSSYLLGWDDEPPKPNKELGELLVTISKSPKMIQLNKDFITLDPKMQETVLTLIHGMLH